MAFLKKLHFCVWHDIFYFSGLDEPSVDSQAGFFQVPLNSWQRRNNIRRKNQRTIAYTPVTAMIKTYFREPYLRWTRFHC